MRVAGSGVEEFRHEFWVFLTLCRYRFCLKAQRVERRSFLVCCAIRFIAAAQEGERKDTPHLLHLPSCDLGVSENRGP